MTHTSKSDLAEFELEGFQKAIINAAVDAIIIIDHSGIIRYFSPSAERLFGYSAQQCTGMNVSMLMPATDAKKHDEYIDRYIEGGQAKIIGIGRDVTGLRADGTVFPMHLSVGEAKQGNNHYFVGICHDLTSRHTILQKLSMAEKRFKDVVQNQREFICRLDEQGALTFFNRAIGQQLAYSDDELAGCSLTSLIYVEDQKRFLQALLRLRHGDSHKITVSIRMSDKQQNTHWIKWRFSLLPDDSEFHNEIQGFGIDITEQVNAENRAEFLAQHDVLTGLLNKDGLQQQFEHFITEKQQYAVFLTDCRRFRLINQKYGQETGDQILIEVAARLSGFMPGNLYGRVGSNNFAIVMPINDPAAVWLNGQKILSVLQQPYLLHKERIMLSVAIGVSIYPQDSDNISELLRQAESAMSNAKYTHSPIGLYHQSIRDELSRWLEVEQGIKRALEHDLFDIVLQPKFLLKSGVLAGYEALIRWNDPVLGSVPPDAFIKVAEAVNLGIALDKWVINKVLSQLKSWHDAGFNIKPVAINITARHFSEAGLFDVIARKLQKYSLPAHYIELEVTEGVVMNDSPAIMENLTAFRKLGIKIAIDDFGTGYSSLGYLRTLPLDFIKIDRVFINDLHDRKNLGLVKAMIAMAYAIDVQVVAEGIETQQQAELLNSLGCHIGQGFWYSRPLALADVSQKLVKVRY